MPLDRLASARSGAVASHTASTPLVGELDQDCGPAHFEVIFGAPRGSPNGTENESQNGYPKRPKADPQRDPKGTPKRALKADFKGLFSEKLCNIASLRIAWRHVASHRIASSRVSPGKPSKREKTILENVR